MLRPVESSNGHVRVSVVIPCHNVAGYIRESVESVLAQTTPASEIVVVDDGSTDDSAEIVEAIPGVRLISLPKRGVSTARNHGIEQTSGDFVLFHDADDRLLPDAIAVGLRAFELHPECGFVYGFARQIDARGSLIETDDPRPVPNASYATMLAGSPPAPPSTLLFRRSALEAVDGFHTEREPTEDVDLYLRVARSFPIHCHGQTITEYRRHDENVSARSPSRTLRQAHAMFELQRPAIGDDPDLLAALDEGKRYFSAIFGESLGFEVFESLRAREIRKAASILPFALRHAPRGLLVAGGHYFRRSVEIASRRLRHGASRATS